MRDVEVTEFHITARYRTLRHCIVILYYRFIFYDYRFILLLNFIPTVRQSISIILFVVSKNAQLINTAMGKTDRQ